MKRTHRFDFAMVRDRDMDMLIRKGGVCGILYENGKRYSMCKW